MFKLKMPIEYYNKCYSEYLIEKYQAEFFKYGIDIGACGSCHMWHVYNMALKHKNALIIGIEPNDKYFKELETENKKMNNVILYKQFYGKELSLKDIIDKNNIDINKNWYISCDCEGDEKYLFAKDNIEYLSKCSHIALEFHETWCGISYDEFIKKFEVLLKDTHKGFRTYYEKRPNSLFSSMVFIQTDIYNDKDNNIQNIIEYLILHPPINNSKSHYITELF